MREGQVSIYYRTCSRENTASRPSWYSKEICLKSMLLSCGELSRQGIRWGFTLLFDGRLSPHDEWLKTLKRLVEPRGLIIESEQKGNAESTFNAIRKATGEPSTNIVVLAEDDYLWLQPALPGLYHALTQLPVDYATPYDHPVRYQPDYPGGADHPHRDNAIYITSERHWRTQESTCMTFASVADTISHDLPYFEKHKDNGKGRPGDRELFRELQGLGDYSYREPTDIRVLVGPIPSLATHAHLPWLAPLIDWEANARRIFGEELK